MSELDPQAQPQNQAPAVNVFNPDGELVSIPQDQVQSAVNAQGYRLASPAEVQDFADQQQYGTPGQQAITGLEGAASAATFGLSTGAERALGVPAADIQGRRRANPTTHMLSAVPGLAVSALIPGLGEANALKVAGEGAAGVAAEAGLGAVGQAAVRSGVETALFQAGDETSKALSADPQQSAETAMINIGAAGLLGSGIGAAFGAVPALWRSTHEGQVGQALQSLKNRATGEILDSAVDAPVHTIEKASLFDRLTQLKDNAPEINAIGERNQWPVLEGMTSGSKEVQMAEDALLNGPPSIPSIERRQIYQGAYDAVTNSLENTLGSEVPQSEAQLGQQIRQSLSQSLSEEYSPIKDLYQEIEPYRQAIPITDRSTGSLSRNILKINEEMGLIPGSERYDFVKTFASGIDSIDNLQKLKNFRTEVWKSSGPMTKDLAGAISEKLDGVERRAIQRFSETMRSPEAKSKILDLIAKADEANQNYSAYREKLQTLGKALGKSKIYGPQNFLDFIQEINPQSLARKVFNENNVEFAQWFAKEFPSEMKSVIDYQKGVLRQEAFKNDVFNPKVALKKAFGMEPEMQGLLFNPQERQLLQDAKTYLNSFPPRFNPSGTAHETAFRAFFEHPGGAALANIRDYAIRGFVKAFGRVSPEAESQIERLLPFLGKGIVEKDPSPTGFKNAVEYALASLKGETALSKATQAVFEAGKDIIPASLAVSEKQIDKLDKRLGELRVAQGELLQTGGQTGYYLPNHGVALGTVAARVNQFLQDAKPNVDPPGPLDEPRKVSEAEQAQYRQKLQIAQQPLTVLQSLQKGQLTPQEVATFKTLYPALYQRTAQKLFDQIIERKSKGETIPYAKRLNLSLFLGQPLDSSMTPQAIQAFQPKPNQPLPPSQSGTPKAQGSLKNLGKLDSLEQTPLQSRQKVRALGS